MVAELNLVQLLHVSARRHNPQHMVHPLRGGLHLTVAVLVKIEVHETEQGGAFLFAECRGFACGEVDKRIIKHLEGVYVRLLQQRVCKSGK